MLNYKALRSHLLQELLAWRDLNLRPSDLFKSPIEEKAFKTLVGNLFPHTPLSSRDELDAYQLFVSAQSYVTQTPGDNLFNALETEMAGWPSLPKFSLYVALYPLLTSKAFNDEDEVNFSNLEKRKISAQWDAYDRNPLQPNGIVEQAIAQGSPELVDFLLQPVFGFRLREGLRHLFAKTREGDLPRAQEILEVLAKHAAACYVSEAGATADPDATQGFEAALETPEMLSVFWGHLKEIGQADDLKRFISAVRFPFLKGHLENARAFEVLLDGVSASVENVLIERLLSGFDQLGPEEAITLLSHMGIDACNIHLPLFGQRLNATFHDAHLKALLRALGYSNVDNEAQFANLYPAVEAQPFYDAAVTLNASVLSSRLDVASKLEYSFAIRQLLLQPTEAQWRGFQFLSKRMDKALFTQSLEDYNPLSRWFWRILYAFGLSKTPHQKIVQSLSEEFHAKRGQCASLPLADLFENVSPSTREGLAQLLLAKAFKDFWRGLDGEAVHALFASPQNLAKFKEAMGDDWLPLIQALISGDFARDFSVFVRVHSTLTKGQMHEMLVPMMEAADAGVAAVEIPKTIGALSAPALIALLKTLPPRVKEALSANQLVALFKTISPSHYQMVLAALFKENVQAARTVYLDVWWQLDEDKRFAFIRALFKENIIQMAQLPDFLGLRHGEEGVGAQVLTDILGLVFERSGTTFSEQTLTEIQTVLQAIDEHQRRVVLENLAPQFKAMCTQLYTMNNWMRFVPASRPLLLSAFKQQIFSLLASDASFSHITPAFVVEMTQQQYLTSDEMERLMQILPSTFYQQVITNQLTTPLLLACGDEKKLQAAALNHLKQSAMLRLQDKHDLMASVDEACFASLLTDAAFVMQGESDFGDLLSFVRTLSDTKKALFREQLPREAMSAIMQSDAFYPVMHLLNEADQRLLIGKMLTLEVSQMNATIAALSTAEVAVLLSVHPGCLQSLLDGEAEAISDVAKRHLNAALEGVHLAYLGQFDVVRESFGRLYQKAVPVEVDSGWAAPVAKVAYRFFGRPTQPVAEQALICQVQRELSLGARTWDWIRTTTACDLFRLEMEKIKSSLDHVVAEEQKIRRLSAYVSLTPEQIKEMSKRQAIMKKYIGQLQESLGQSDLRGLFAITPCTAGGRRVMLDALIREIIDTMNGLLPEPTVSRVHEHTGP